MDAKMLEELLEPIYHSSVPIQNVARKTSQEQWTMETGGERCSGRSTMMIRTKFFRINKFY